MEKAKADDFLVEAMAGTEPAMAWRRRAAVNFILMYLVCMLRLQWKL
jgi:hypothetical protein